MNDVLDLFKKMGAVGLETKSNEVMHTTNAGFGQEFVPTEEFRSEIIDIMPQQGKLLPLLPGSHGFNLPKRYTAPAVGLSVGDLLFQGKPEWTTGTPAETEDDHGTSRVPTGSISIDQQEFIAEVRISDKQLKYNAVNTEEYVKKALAAGMMYTVESAIINGDSEAGSTGNVNSDDQAPATTFAALGGSRYHATMIDHGIRELAINGANTVNVGTLGVDDYLAVLALLGEYGSSPEDSLIIQSNHVTMKSLGIAEFLTAQNSADKATVQTGLRPSPFGVNTLTHRAVPRTEADGKLSGATPAGNVKGQFLAVYKPAIQYGFGQDFKLEVVRVPGYGYRLVATFDFGFKIIDGGASTPTVAAGINITL